MNLNRQLFNDVNEQNMTFSPYFLTALLILFTYNMAINILLQLKVHITHCRFIQHKVPQKNISKIP